MVVVTGSQCIEDTPLSVCVKLVVDSRRERRQREEAERQKHGDQEITNAAGAPPAEPPAESPAEPQDNPDITEHITEPPQDQKSKQVVFIEPNKETVDDDNRTSCKGYKSH